MAQTVGIVIETQDDGHAVVMAEKEQGCGSCMALAQCHAGSAGHTQKTAAINQAGASVGDRVTLTVASGALLSRMAVLYLVPVMGMLAGAFLGTYASSAGGSDGRSIAFSLLGFLFGFAISVVISRIWSSRQPIQAVITRIIPPGNLMAPPRPAAGCGCGK
ncbi:putative Positive regulator of sigma E, RseC/MucC [Desulfosarcina cetonica]|uniref:SoxR reducing system RseC family protein n=1 Tax=Desulfosarcina cetonica TaxID=90730 RepID=UPI0006D1AC84|nr:SoxR reducing system RseC family protein [Desulfosarcina cetonica]VTR67953.1 putative Positive regulator of sigma E, RseC/MucC [Desulfosarcina cetonica]